MVSERTTVEHYQDIDAVNWSSLQHMRHSPLHYQTALTVQPKETDAVRLGRFFHTLVLEPERVDEDYAFFTGKQRRGPEWDRFKADSIARGRTILAYGTQGTRQTVDNLRRLSLVVRSHPLVAPLLYNGDFKRTFSCVDAETGVSLKCRPDIVHPVLKTWADLKTCRSADPFLFGRSASHFGYHLQAAFHLRVIRQAGGVEIERALLLPVEKTLPFDVGSCIVENDVLEAADVEITRMLRQVVECRESGVWAGRYQCSRLLKLL